MTQVTPTPDQPTPPPRTGRALRWALFFSLAINVLFVGLVAGAMLRHHGPGGPRAMEGAAFAPYIQALPRADQRALRGEFLRARPDLADLAASRRADTLAFAKIVATDPFDPEAARHQIDAQIGQGGARLASARDVLVARLAAMPADLRRAYAERLTDLAEPER